MIEFFNCVITNFMRVCFIGVIAGIVFAYIPASVFERADKFLKPFKFEKNGRFYEKYFKISKWKDKLPQFSNIVKIGFHLNNMEVKSEEYLDRFIVETLRSEVTHIFLMAISPVFILWNDNLVYGIIATCLYFLGNLPFLMIQRYNRPRVKKLKEMFKLRKIKCEQK